MAPNSTLKLHTQGDSAPSARAVTAGLHHVTAMAGDPQRNLDFYQKTLGLRLVKVTVNFDDPGTYHFYFGDDTGTPGSLLTFFPWPGARPGRAGHGEVSATAFAIAPGTLQRWQERLRREGAAELRTFTRFGAQGLAFHDPDGMRLEVIETPEVVGDRITAFHSVTLTVATAAATIATLRHGLGMRVRAETEDAGKRTRLEADGAAVGAGIVDVVEDPVAGAATLGAGSVHHVAFRARDDAHQDALKQQLRELNIAATEQRERVYFRSVYLREPGRVLLEIATDEPGFAADQPVAELGTRLMLPPWLEVRRGDIERVLPKIKLPHRADDRSGQDQSGRSV